MVTYAFSYFLFQIRITFACMSKSIQILAKVWSSSLALEWWFMLLFWKESTLRSIVQKCTLCLEIMEFLLKNDVMTLKKHPWYIKLASHLNFFAVKKPENICLIVANQTNIVHYIIFPKNCISKSFFKTCFGLLHLTRKIFIYFLYFFNVQWIKTIINIFQVYYKRNYYY